MSLTLLLCGMAGATRVYWTAPPSEEDRAALERTLPGASSHELMELATGGGMLPPDDPHAVDHLRQELDAVRPLLSEFDGELQIMARLTKAAADVHALHSGPERDLYYQALLFTGFAVSRYYQDKLGSDPAAAPYRSGEGTDAKITAWMEAAALYGAPSPTVEALPEAPQRIAFDSVQALVRGMPSATLVVGTLAAGAKLSLDGELVTGGPNTRITITPGRHFWQVESGGMVLLRKDERIKAGVDVAVEAPVGPIELEMLKQMLASHQDGWSLSENVALVVRQAAEPVYAASPGRTPRLVRLDGDRVATIRIVPKPEESHLSLRGAAGVGWSSTGDWLLQNQPEAPSSKATVNAVTPAFSLGVEYHLARVFAVGVGVDGLVPTGAYHSLPTGDDTTRAFIYPHVSLGLKWAQVTAGPLLPWHLGIGVEAHIPVWGPLEVFGSGVLGIGFDRPRTNGPTFEPAPLYTAWGGLSYRWDG